MFYKILGSFQAVLGLIIVLFLDSVSFRGFASHGLMAKIIGVFLIIMGCYIFRLSDTDKDKDN